MTARARFYLVGAYGRRAELEAYAERFVAAGLGFVTSTWLSTPQEGLDAGFSVGNLDSAEAAALAWAYGQRDLYDLSRSDAIVSFTGEGGRGGRHIEHGYAIGRMEIDDPREWPLSRLIVVGPREHVFHCHPATEVYADFAAFMAHEMLVRVREETSK